MPTNNVQFKRGTAAAFANVATKDSNTIYFITDTNRLFVGDSEYTRPVQHGSELPTSKNPANSLFVKETGTSRELYYSKDGAAWDMVAYLPATITGGVFGDNTAGTVAYGGTVRVPKVTIDNRGYVTAAEDVTLTLPASDKVTTVTTTGDGNAVTGGSISNDGTTLTLTKGESFVPASGGTFTGAVTLSGAPTTDLNPATKKYVDDSISSAISASDAMVFKGTVGTSGTAASFSAINVSSATEGDTYKVITADTLPAVSSFDSTAHILTPGDLIVYMGKSKFIYVPSGDEEATSVKIAGSGDTINVSTTAQTGNLVLGTAAGVNTTSTVTNDSTTVPTTAAVKTYVDNVEFLAMPKTGGTFTGDVTMNADFTAQDKITIASADTQENLINGQQHSDTKLIFDNANPVSGAVPMSIEGYYNAAVYGTHAYDDSTIKINATNFEVGGLVATEAGGTGYGTGSDITTGMVFLNTNEVRLAATEQTAEDAIGMIGEVHDKVNLAFSNTGFYSVTNEATASIEGYYTFKEYDDEDNTNNVDTAHLDLIADDIKLDGDVKVTNNLTTKTLTINPEDRTSITASGQIHDISTLTFANDNQVDNTDKLAAIVAQYSANVVGGGVHVEDWSTLKLQADTVQLADLAIGGVDIGSAQTVTLTPQHNIPIDRVQKVNPESIIMRYNVAQYEGQNDSTDILLNASNIITQGPITLPGEPTQANHAVNKSYVDTALLNATDTKVTTVTTSGDGNAVTAGSISLDGTTLTLTKNANFVPATGGTFTGDVEVDADLISQSLTVTGTENGAAPSITLKLQNENDSSVNAVISAELSTVTINGDTRNTSTISLDSDTVLARSLQVSDINDLSITPVNTYENNISECGTELSSISTYFDSIYSSPTIDFIWRQGGGGATSTKLALKTDATGFVEIQTPEIYLNAVSGIHASAPVILSADPVNNMQAATKQYVDNAISSASMTWETF